MIANLAVEHTVEMSALLEQGEGSAREEFKKLFTWKPGYLPKEVMDEWKESGGEGVPPFFCELTLYAILGKDSARTLLGMMRSLGEALGIDSRRDLHDELEEESKGVDRRSALNHEDIDALEGFMRYDASYRFHCAGDDDANRIIKIMKALPALRAMVDGGQDHDWLHLIPDEVQVGDRIFSSGRFITVYGFLDENKKPVDRPIPFGEPLASYEVPRKTRERDKTEVVLEYSGVIKTSEDDDWGWRLPSKDILHVLRKKKIDT